jgi:hypothetical protein
VSSLPRGAFASFARAGAQEALQVGRVGIEPTTLGLKVDGAASSSSRTDTVEARSALAAAEGYAVGASQREYVDAARAGFERWLRALYSDIAAYRRGSQDQAIQASLGSTRQLCKTCERSLADAYALGARSIESATSSLSSSASRSVTILLVYLVIALLIGLGVTMWSCERL